MKNLAAICMFVVAVLFADRSPSHAQEFPDFPKPEEEHAWLQQLAGEWTSEGQMFMKPGQPPLKTTGTENVRSLGGFWIMCENKSEFMGQPCTGIMTLGYDADKKHYVGTWIDSMTGHLWTYQGRLDEAGKVLTLETSGPVPGTSGTVGRFKDVLELKSKDHKVLSSWMQGEDGKWSQMMQMDYRRKK